ncbi:MAG: 16S rRNA (adenine(1518)-N(6)/adenine(1519)-N(6))-dimethyltransferase RsmA [Melioribacteraceae bacterium]|nr:16S rRNA (adenine(1518)-N(6)/adenine(1519)-N(6))-dimethyltransferase RsmA [Melioribacteraceae bacterium]
MQKVKPLKRFGQNYLQDKNTIQKIVDIFSPKEDDLIIEIGPGQGALTKYLSDKSKKYFAIEIDKRVIDDLINNFPNVIFINQDFLTINLYETVKHLISENSKIRIIGNIPYNITSPILFKLIENRNIINDALLMTQHEVAKRIVAKPNTKDYSILSVLLNYFTTPEYCFKISRNVFYPKPNVDSAIIKIDFSKNKTTDIDDDKFIKVVKACFGNRRKTLKNSLSNSQLKNIDLNKINFDFSKRAEQLEIEDFIYLTKCIQELSY